jgi:Xaa-Pro aminopeptidase
LRTLTGNLDLLRTEVERSGLDALVLLSPENVTYTSGTIIATMKSLRERLEIVVWPAKGDPAFVVCDLEEVMVRSNTWIEDVHRYVEFKQSPIATLAEVLREKGLDRGKLGIETSYLLAKFWDELKEALPDATWVPCDRLMGEIRAIKTAEEIDLLAHGARMTEKAHHVAYSLARPGDTEKSMADAVAGALLKLGADEVSFLFLNAGARTGQRHLAAGDYRVQPGDLIKTDAGGTFSGYISDVARTVVMGRPSDAQRKTYDQLFKIHMETMESCLAGKTGRDVYEVARAGFEREALPFPVPHEGHGVGLGGHEIPHLSLVDQTTLKPGMTIYVETRLLVPEKEGYHIEDLLLVNPEGPPTILTSQDYSRELWSIE